MSDVSNKTWTLHSPRLRYISIALIRHGISVIVMESSPGAPQHMMGGAHRMLATGTLLFTFPPLFQWVKVFRANHKILLILTASVQLSTMHLTIHSAKGRNTNRFLWRSCIFGGKSETIGQSIRSLWRFYRAFVSVRLWPPLKCADFYGLFWLHQLKLFHHYCLEYWPSATFTSIRWKDADCR